MKPIPKKIKQWIWRFSLLIGLVVEIVFIGMAITSLAKEKEFLEPWQERTFIAIAVWIYIAYLKQRSLDISRYVVDEKIKTHSLVQNLRDGIIVVDAENRILLLNAKASAITGLSELDALNRNLTEFVDASIAALLTSEQSGETEGVIRSTERPVRISMIRLPEDAEKEQSKLIYVYPHIPKTTDAETASQQDQSQSVLQSIAQMGQLACEFGKTLAPSLPADIRINRAQLALQGYAQQYRLMSGCLQQRLQDKALVKMLKPSGIQAGGLLNALISELQPVTTSLNIPFDYAPAPADLTIKGDPGWIGHAVRQVLCNALIDMAPQSGPVLIRTAAMGMNVGIAIIERGPHFSEDAIAALFTQPYAGIAAADGQRLRVKGSGMFLARGIVEAHGGTLVAESPDEGGLRVTMMLPG